MRSKKWYNKDAVPRVKEKELRYFKSHLEFRIYRF